MAGKSKLNRKSPGARQPLTLVRSGGTITKPDPKRLTLADVTVTWADRQLGVERSADGAVLAWLLTRAAHLTGSLELHALDVAQGTGPQLLRGMGAVLYPDAGEPVANIDADRRYFLSWVVEELAAQQHADLLHAGPDRASTFTVTVGRK